VTTHPPSPLNHSALSALSYDTPPWLLFPLTLQN
jgi:hypothetical protein